MMHRLKRPSWQKYLVVLVITIAIFIFGLLVGSWTSTRKLQSVRVLQDDLRAETLDFETQYDLLRDEPCTFGNTSTLINELYELSLRLDFMEQILGPRDKRVLALKSYYSLLELRHWLFLKRLQQRCGRNYTLILYFYSNKKGECPACDEQGFVLTWLRKNHPNVQVFSFDVNLPLNSLDTIKQRYGVEKLPFIVIDDKSYAGFQSKEALLWALTERGNRTTGDTEHLNGETRT